jgi:hypothetical protein
MSCVSYAGIMLLFVICARAFCKSVGFSAGVVAIGFGAAVPVVVGGVRTQPAPMPMMAADRAMIGSTFMDFSRRNECRLLGLQRSCERAARAFIPARFRLRILPMMEVVCADRSSALHASA